MKLVFLMLLAFVMLLGCACGQGSETGVTDTDETQLLTETEPVAETEPETEPARPFVKPEISEELKKEYYGYINQAWREKIDEIKATQGNDFTFLVRTDPHSWVGGGKKTLRFSKPVTVYEVYEKKTYAQNATEVEFDAYFGETKMFYYG